MPLLSKKGCLLCGFHPGACLKRGGPECGDEGDPQFLSVELCILENFHDSTLVRSERFHVRFFLLLVCSVRRKWGILRNIRVRHRLGWSHVFLFSIAYLRQRTALSVYRCMVVQVGLSWLLCVSAFFPFSPCGFCVWAQWVLNCVPCVGFRMFWRNLFSGTESCVGLSRRLDL